MKQTLRFVCFTIACASACAHATPFWEESWIEVRSPHFDVVSRLSAPRTVDLVNNLENFRAAIQLITNIKDIADRVPTKLYVFDRRDGAFVDTGFAGWFTPRMRANYAVVIPDSGVGFGAVIKHEYVHFLLHNADATRYPPWFDEGFATKFETMEVHDKVIEYGQPALYVLQNLQYGTWVNFEPVLGARNVFDLSSNQRDMFYMQSWLLVHYLTERPEHDFGAEMKTYLTSVEAGATPVDAFLGAFSLHPEQLRPILYTYQRNKLRTTTIKMKMPFPTQPTSVATVAPDSIATQLADLLVVRDRLGDAKLYYDAALAIDANNANALVGLGDLLKFAAKFDEAQPYYERAIALEPKNAYHELDYGEFFADRAAAHPEQLAVDLVEARRHFARAYAIDPNLPETLAMNGETYLREGKSIEKALVSLNSARAMLPAQPQVTMLLAEAYARSNQRAEALKLLRACIAWGSDSSQKDVEQATRMLDQWTAPDTSDEARGDAQTQ
jgi:tetratricopeptide (TPR) repeat protein